jgi:NADH-quinone oxidoreductase subunit I
MDKDFELSTRERFDALLMRRDDLAKSNDYYRRISPTDAAEVDRKLTAAAEAAAKKKAAAAPAATKPATPTPPASNEPAPTRASS